MRSILRWEPLAPPPATRSGLVAGVAAERGVSERTVWRWLATMRATEARELPRRVRACERCGGPLPRSATVRRRYCEARCRVGAYRARRRLRGGDLPVGV